MTLPSQKYLLENLLYERSVWFPDKGRAPYLAGLSRDVGFRCSFPLTLDSSDALSGQHRWYPTSREKRARYGAPVLCEGIRAPQPVKPCPDTKPQRCSSETSRFGAVWM